MPRTLFAAKTVAGTATNKQSEPVWNCVVLFKVNLSIQCFQSWKQGLFIYFFEALKKSSQWRSNFKNISLLVLHMNACLSPIIYLNETVCLHFMSFFLLFIINHLLNLPPSRRVGACVWGTGQWSRSGQDYRRSQPCEQTDPAQSGSSGSCLCCFALWGAKCWNP